MIMNFVAVSQVLDDLVGQFVIHLMCLNINILYDKDYVRPWEPNPFIIIIIIVDGGLTKGGGGGGGA